MKKHLLLPAFMLLITNTLFCQNGRTVTDLSNQNWQLRLDTAAAWIHDSLYTPPVNMKALTVNGPSGGWQALQKMPGKTVTLPATVEQFYWGRNGNAFGVGGNYLGISWFTTTCMISSNLKGKRLRLQFDAVRFRAEIFINQKLVAYDLVNSTPFEVDITDAAAYGKQNEIAVRITDPNGNFDWRDSQNFMWGNYRTNPTHGFGGITGRVKLVVTNPVFINDVFVQNKPAIDEINISTEINNIGASLVNGTLLIEIKETAGSNKIVYSTHKDIAALQPGINTLKQTITLNNAKHWSVDSPHLYYATVQWVQQNKITDSYTRRFGFRWFEVRNNNGDHQFYLNGKRIVLITAISWGFWPNNGIAPTDAFARKQVMAAKKAGLNMLNFHRTIGQTNVLDYADELGLLYFEEPGGNSYPADRFNATDPVGKMQADFYFTTRNEKLFRMIKRDRSHPSLVIYNLHNERGAEPQQQDLDQMQAAHRLDPTRILTYNSSNGSIKDGPDPRFKLHLFPYDTSFYDYGWFDQHHAGGPGTYHDNLYVNPQNYLRHTSKKNEIIYYGEEGAIGTPPRLQLIRHEILKSGNPNDWEAADYLHWYDAYNNFLLNTPGFHAAYPNVDSLTKWMGNVSFYYQGRTIENIKINNIADGYAINGWESMKIENHSGIVDNYRNLKGDPQLIAKYTRPLYLAVKLNRKVLCTGDTTIADFYIVNEKNLQGNFNLEITVSGSGKQILKKIFPVKVSGGNIYGELLHQSFAIAAEQPGYTTIHAALKQNGQTVATGHDEVYAVNLSASGITANGMVADTSNILLPFLQSAGVQQLKSYKSGRPEGKFLLVGAFQPQQTGNPLVTDILEWVNEGNTLIVVNNTEAWAAHLAQKEVADYRGSKTLGTTWYGGNFFSKQHPLFNGLPQAQVFNWEYQCFAAYNRSRIGLRIANGEPVVACVADHKKEVFTALSIVPHGRGRIILSTLDIYACLKDATIIKRAEGDGENAAMNTFNASGKNKANAVGQQLLLNMLKYACR